MNAASSTWIVEAWKSIPREALAASFKTCAIFTATGGSEDHLIHCIKPNGPIPSGRAAPEDALVLDDEDDALLDVSDTEGDEDSHSDASIEPESSSEDGPSQIRTQHTSTSRCGAVCTYTADCHCELCDGDF
ncbi:transposase [Aphelenchoides avenae]|nr:transposase [Aphelenchus avenae]